MNAFKLTILLSSLTIIKARCDGVCINSLYYEKETLVTEVVTPFHLAVDHHANDVYFTYWANDSSIKAAKINLNTREFKNLFQFKNGNAYTIDFGKTELYIGEGHRIYKHNLTNRTKKFYDFRNVTITNMHFKNALYFTTHPDSKLYKIKDGTLSLLEDLDRVWDFLIDDDGTMFFYNETGLFRKQMDSASAMAFKVPPGSVVTSLGTDRRVVLYACLNDGGVYRVKKETLQLDKLFTLTEPLKPFSLSFNKDSIIIAEWFRGIYRLDSKGDLC